MLVYACRTSIACSGEQSKSRYLETKGMLSGNRACSEHIRSYTALLRLINFSSEPTLLKNLIKALRDRLKSHVLQPGYITFANTDIKFTVAQLRKDRQ